MKTNEALIALEIPADNLTPIDRLLLAGRYEVTLRTLPDGNMAVWIVRALDGLHDTPAFYVNGNLPIFATEDGAKRAIQRRIMELYEEHPEVRP